MLYPMYSDMERYKVLNKFKADLELPKDFDKDSSIPLKVSNFYLIKVKIH